MNVSITDDVVNEPEETFSLSLTKISSFVTLSERCSLLMMNVRCFITDDDAELKAKDM